ncbi:MAG TPA: large conductance mechanosensitive channel protein MscL [Candidatus Saccharimonadales bacterium]
MVNDFKKFILRGNVIDLAVAVLIGAAFNSVITALVRDMLTPLITAVRGKGTDFSHLSFTIHGSVFMYGDFLNELVSFIVIAAVIFFFVVQPINKLVAYSNRGREAEEAKEKDCPECLSKIPKAAKRCAFCTAVLKKA